MSLLDALKQRELSDHGEQTKGRGVRLFLAQKQEISEAIKEGWTYKQIHSLLQEQGKMPVVYRVFCQYVYKFITSKKANSEPDSDLKSNHNSQSQKKQRLDGEPLQNKKPDKIRQTESGKEKRVPRGLETPRPDDPSLHQESSIFKGKEFPNAAVKKKHEKIQELLGSNETEKVGNEAFPELDINEDEFFAPAKKEPVR